MSTPNQAAIADRATPGISRSSVDRVLSGDTPARKQQGETQRFQFGQTTYDLKAVASLGADEESQARV